jgi:carboxymethylenebutenolidase
MTPNYVDSVIKPGDPRLKSEFITYESLKEAVKSKLFYRSQQEETARNHRSTRKSWTESLY